MPELFPSLTSFVACCAIIAGAQLIYSAAGFGAGMFAVTLLALVLPDLAGSVATLLLLTLLIEVAVLFRAWRSIQLRLVGPLVPGMLVGLPIGTALLALGPVDDLKRILGIVVAAAGAWFLWSGWRPARHATPQFDPAAPVTPATKSPSAASASTDAVNASTADTTPNRPAAPWVVALPVGFVSGTLAGLFGTGGPPVIITLRALGLTKSAFRATLLTYFLLMSVGRSGWYLAGGLFTLDYVLAALWLLPATLVGWLAGMWLHTRVSERAFSQAVAILLLCLGLMLGTTS